MMDDDDDHSDDDGGDEGVDDGDNDGDGQVERARGCSRRASLQNGC